MNSFLLYMAIAITIGLAPGYQAKPEHQHGMGMMQSCPMKVPGAVASVADVENGIAVTITTESGDIAVEEESVSCLTNNCFFDPKLEKKSCVAPRHLPMQSA
jgi:hypothetical protein